MIVLVDKYIGQNVLEVGCGKGVGLMHLRKKYYDVNFTGVDLAKENIRIAKNLDDNIDWVVGDAMKPLNKLGEFDTVLNVESSHCYPDFDRFLNNIYKSISYDGVVLMADFRNNNMWTAIEESFQKAHFEIIDKLLANEDVDEEELFNVLEKYIDMVLILLKDLLKTFNELRTLSWIKLPK